MACTSSSTRRVETPPSPSRHRRCVDDVRQALGVSERRACRVLRQHRSTQRKVPQGRPDEDRLTEDVIELARTYGRYGYRMVTGLLNQSGWHVNSHAPDDAQHRRKRTSGSNESGGGKG